jgi:hypothetical protein
MNGGPESTTPEEISDLTRDSDGAGAYEHLQRPRAFGLQRDEDVSGVSGTGIVAEGVEFSDGTVALRWTSEWPTSVVFHERGIESVEAVHGHDGRTQILFTLDNWIELASGKLAEAILRAQHSKDWYIGNATEAEWETAYEMVAAAFATEGD